MAAASTSASASASVFSILSDDLLLNILVKLESDPREWARLSCVSLRFSSLIHLVCYKAKCLLSSPPDLLSPSPPPPPWPSLHKLSVCCPGLLHSGVLLHPHFSDFGLELDIGPDHLFRPTTTLDAPPSRDRDPPGDPAATSNQDPCWSLFDDLYCDTIYDVSEAHLPLVPTSPPPTPPPPNPNPNPNPDDLHVPTKHNNDRSSPAGAHLAAERWNLSREEGRKLLASRFRGDALYLSEFPGCVHVEERRSYMIFRGLFRDFKGTGVWRSLVDGKRRAIDIACAYCDCTETWDLHAAFCLRRVFGYHDDGEPVVRAYVCQNGHVAGAWTDNPVRA